MTELSITDTRDIILEWMKAEERNLSWLSKKSGIAYGTLYSIFIQRTYDLNEEKLSQINLGTNQSFTKDFNNG